MSPMATTVLKIHWDRVAGDMWCVVWSGGVWCGLVWSVVVGFGCGIGIARLCLACLVFDRRLRRQYLLPYYTQAQAVFF